MNPMDVPAIAPSEVIEQIQLCSIYLSSVKKQSVSVPLRAHALFTRYFLKDSGFFLQEMHCHQSNRQIKKVEADGPEYPYA